MYRVPAFVEEMARRKWLGDKTGQGFYKKVKGEGEKRNTHARRQHHGLSPAPESEIRFAGNAAKTIDDTAERLRALLVPVLLGQPGDKAQQFLWGSLSEMCLYAARRVPEISDPCEDVDRAMRWGFGWELGPFELMDALGVPAFARQIVRRKAARCLRSSKKLLADGRDGFYTRQQASPRSSNPTARRRESEEPPGVIFLKSLKDAGKEVERNSGASLIDLGDGVVCCEFHSKMNAIGADLIAMLHQGTQAPRHRFRRHGHRQSGRQFFRGRQSHAGADGARRNRSGTTCTWP